MLTAQKTAEWASVGEFRGLKCPCAHEAHLAEKA